MTTPWPLLRRDGSLQGLQDDPEAAALLREHGVAGYVFSRLREQGLAAPGELQSAWSEQRQRNLLYGIELTKIGEALTQTGSRAAVLKGMALLGDLYKDGGARSLADIDLLVRGDERTKVLGVLTGLGFAPLKTKRWSANAFKVDLSKMLHGTELVVELHTDLFENAGACEWRREATARPGIDRLRNEEMLVHLMGHLGHQHSFLKLSWLVDIDLLIRAKAPQIDWDRVASMVEALGHRRSASAVLWAARTYLGTPTDHPVGERLIQPGWERWLTSRFLWHPRKNLLRYYGVKHRLKDSLREALWYDLRWLRSVSVTPD